MRRMPNWFSPPWGGIGNPLCGLPWYNWYNTNGRTGEEPPEEIKTLFTLVEEWKTTLPGTEKYKELGGKILTINVKGLYRIGTVGLSPWPVIVNNDLHNTPENGTFDSTYDFWMPYQADQWFFKK